MVVAEALATGAAADKRRLWAIGLSAVFSLYSEAVTLSSVGWLIIHKNTDNEKLNTGRARRFADLPFEEKMKELFALIDLARKTSGNQPLKKPEGLGLAIAKKKQDG